MSNNFFSSAADLLMPPKCAVCGEKIGRKNIRESRAMCPVCCEKFTTELNLHCPVCDKTFDMCRCKPENFLPEDFAFALPYCPECSCSRKLILCCKNRRHKAVIRTITEKMLQTAEKRSIIFPDTIITYVPRSPEKTVRLGTDQAKELAVDLAALSGNKCFPLIIRRENGCDQKSLSRKQRISNTLGVYEFNAAYEQYVRGGRILVIDDVVTTGSTVNACTEVLKDSGAGSVACLAAAKTVSSVRSLYTVC